MIKIDTSNNVKAASLDDIINFEKKRGLTLPQDYRDFILETNGGDLQEFAVFSIPEIEDESVLQFFYSLVDKPRSIVSLDGQLDLSEPRIPRELILIGSDACSNQIALKAKGPGFGRVYFWDLRREYEEIIDGTFENFFPVADSFTEFLSMLKIEEI